MRNLYTLPRIGQNCTRYRVDFSVYNYHDMRFNKSQTTNYSYMICDFLNKLMVENQCRISQLFIRWMNKNVYSNPDKKYNHIDFDFSTGMFTFVPAAKMGAISQDLTASVWSSKLRQSMKPARFVKDLLNPRLTKRMGDHHFAKFATHCKAYMEQNKVTISEEDFDVGYSKDNVHSCMAGKPVSDFYNCFDTTLLVARKSSGQMVGRAILWNDVLVNGKQTKFLDRVYGNEIVKIAFQKYAKDNNLFFYDDVDEEQITVKTINDFKFTDASFMPYTDTFQYGMRDEQTLSNEKTPEQRFTFDNSSGAAEDNGNKEGYVYFAWDNRYYPPEEVITVKGGQYHISDNRIVNLKGVWYLYSDSRIVQVTSGFLGTEVTYYLREDVDYCAYSNKWYPKEQLTKYIDEYDGKEYIVAVNHLEKIKLWLAERQWMKDIQKKSMYERNIALTQRFETIALQKCII